MGRGAWNAAVAGVATMVAVGQAAEFLLSTRLACLCLLGHSDVTFFAA
jgi:hypothetical protein